MNRVNFTPKTIGVRVPLQRNPFAAAQLRGLGAYRGLGDDNADSQILFINGFDAQQVQYIISQHDSGALSDAGYQMILNGQVAPEALSQFLSNDPGAPTVVQQAISSQPAPTTQPAAGVPTGTLLSYSATWETTIHDSDPQDILRQVLGALSGNGLTVVGQNLNVGILGTISAAAFIATKFSVSIQVQVANAGFNKPSDIQSIIDHLAYTVSGELPITSSISIGATPVGSAATSSSPVSTGDWTTVLLIGAFAVVLLKR